MKNQESSIMRKRSTIRSNITPTLFNIFVKVFQKKYYTKQNFLRIFSEELSHQNQKIFKNLYLNLNILLSLHQRLLAQIVDIYQKTPGFKKTWPKWDFLNNKC